MAREMNIAEILMMRFEFEELTSGYNLAVDGSSINSLEWFVENGHRSNSLRNGFDDAMKLAKTILAEAKKYGSTKETGDG